MAIFISKSVEETTAFAESYAKTLKAGDIGILDRAYNCFKTLHKQSERCVIFVV